MKMEIICLSFLLVKDFACGRTVWIRSADFYKSVSNDARQVAKFRGEGEVVSRYVNHSTLQEEEKAEVGDRNDPWHAS